jgi:hypothetical protein
MILISSTDDQILTLKNMLQSNYLIFQDSPHNKQAFYICEEIKLLSFPETKRLPVSTRDKQLYLRKVAQCTTQK